MSSWVPRTTRSGIEYGGAQGSYYWTYAYNAGANSALCLANCTTYVYGRLQEAGDTPPVVYGFPNAQYWHGSLANGWTYIPYRFEDLEPGDVLEWSNGMNHVAVVEEVGTSPYNYYRVSESLYTSRDESMSLAQISAWMIANYPNRFFYYGQGTSAYSAAPTYILKNPAHHGIGENGFRFLSKKKKYKRRVMLYV